MYTNLKDKRKKIITEKNPYLVIKSCIVVVTLSRLGRGLMCAPLCSHAGDLMNEDKVLEWLVENKNTGEDDDVIDDVTLGLLNTLIDSMDHLAVIFCTLHISCGYCHSV